MNFNIKLNNLFFSSSVLSLSKIIASNLGINKFSISFLFIYNTPSSIILKVVSRSLFILSNKYETFNFLYKDLFLFPNSYKIFKKYCLSKFFSI